MSRARRLWRVLVGVLVALVVVTPTASADPVIDLSETEFPAEIDMSWIDQDVKDSVPENEWADFEAHVQTAWRNCAAVIRDYPDDNAIAYDPVGGCHRAQKGFETDSKKSFISQAWDNFTSTVTVSLGSTRLRKDNLDLGQLATALGNGAPESKGFLRWSPEFLYNAEQGMDTARAGGAGLAGQLAAGTAQAVGVPGTVVEAVSNPTGSADRMLSRWKEDVSKGMGQALGWLSDGLSFNAGWVSFRNAYAAAAGVGLVLLAGGSLVALVGWRRSELPASEVVSRWGAALAGGLLGLAFTPALLYVVTEASDVLSDGVVSWMQTDQATITGSLLDPFAAMDTSHTLLGWLGVLLLILLMMVGAVMVIAAFAIQWLVAYLGGVGLGLVWGLVPLKGGRRRLAQAGAMVVGAIVARPLMLFMLGVAMRITNTWAPSADGWSMDPSGTFFGLVLSVGALMMACLAPAALVRHVPAMGTGHLGAGFAGGLTGGLAGAGMGASMLAGRMAALAPRRPLRGLSAGRGGGAGGRSAGGAGGGSRSGGLRAAGAAGGGGGAGRSASGGGQGAAGSGRHVAGAEGGVSAPSRQGARDAAVQRGGEPSGAGEAPSLPAQGAPASSGERSVEASRPAGEAGAAGSAGPGRVLTGADLSTQAGAAGGVSGQAGAPRAAGAGRVAGGVSRLAGGVGRAAGAGARVVAGAAGPVAGAAVAAGTHVAAAGVRASGAGLAAGARAVQSARVEDVD